MIKYKQDIPNVARAFLAPLILFAPFVTGIPDGFQIPLMAFAYFLVGNSNYILHLHIHNPFTRSKVFNIALDLSLASVTAMTASNWRIQHLQYHHLGKEMLFIGSKDWEVEKYTPMRALSYCFRSMALTFVRPFWDTFKFGILENRLTPINYRWGFFEHMLLFGFFGFLVWLDWRLALTYVLPLYVLTYFITRYVDYLNHYGCDEDDENHYARANNSLHKRFNKRTHNFGYHTAHHQNPGAHWTKLPEIHQRIESKIPDEMKKDVSWSWMLLPLHFIWSRSGRM